MGRPQSEILGDRPQSLLTLRPWFVRYSGEYNIKAKLKIATTGRKTCKLVVYRYRFSSIEVQ